MLLQTYVPLHLSEKNLRTEKNGLILAQIKFRDSKEGDMYFKYLEKEAH